MSQYHGDHLADEGFAGDFLDLLDFGLLLFADYGDTDSGFACAACTAGAVDVDLAVVWEIVVYDVGELPDVDAAGGDVGCDEYLEVPHLETLHDHVALGLREVARWSGIVFGCNFVSLAIFSPIWGRLADKYGRKPMILRASGWLGCIMIALGFAQSVWQLAGLRLLQGAMSGFQAAVVPLLAAETPKGKSGWAMSMFFAAQVTGGLLGPVFGGGLSGMIVPYYSVIGGWVIHYLAEYLCGRGGNLATDGYFSAFITNGLQAELAFLLFSLFTLGIIFAGVRNGVERVSKVMMPVLDGEGELTAPLLELEAELGAYAEGAEEAYALLVHGQAGAPALVEELEGHIAGEDEVARGVVDAHPLQTGAAADVDKVGAAYGGGVVERGYLVVLRELRVGLRRRPVGQAQRQHGGHGRQYKT